MALGDGAGNALLVVGTPPVNDATDPATWSSKALTSAPSSTSFVVSVAATIWPVSASMPMCNFRQDRRVFVPCFSTSHSPAAQLEAGAVHQQVHGLTVIARPWAWDLQRLCPPAQGGVVRHGQGQPKELDDGADQPLGLP
jgi:hypothetical protein